MSQDLAALKAGFSMPKETVKRDYVKQNGINPENQD